MLEDGKPQQIDSFDFVKFETFTPEAERRDPQSQREGFDLAADPRYRLFVVYVDMALSLSSGAVVPIDSLPHIRQPLTNFFERVVGTSDLFALLTSRNSVKDLTLAQKTTVTAEQVLDLWRAKVIDRDEADEVLGFCTMMSEGVIEALKLRFRADATYTNMRDLVTQLGSLRQERKNVVLVTNLLPRWRPDQNLLNGIVNERGGAVPQAGTTRGRITNDNRDVVTNTRGGNVNGPTVIRVPSWVDRPLGRYFMYFANHMGDSIRLAYGHWRCTGAGARVDDRLDPRLADMARLAAHSGPAARGAV